MLAVWRAAVEQFDQGSDFVLATIISVQGSSPRHVGTRFLVRQDGSIVGTIGGGLFEASVQKVAAEALENRSCRRETLSMRGPDAKSAQMICGGEAEVLVEFVEGKGKIPGEIFRRVLAASLYGTSGYLFTKLSMPVGEEGSTDHLYVDEANNRAGGFPGEEAVLAGVPEKRRLKPAQLLAIPGFENSVLLEWIHPTGTAIIFGAGHVGECVAHLASYVGFRVVVLDDRPEFASPERIPDADQVVVLNSFENALEHVDVDEDSYLVLVTRGHAHDRTVLVPALRTDAAYIGMIGSRRKTKLIFEDLLDQGFTREDLQRVNSPIGLPIGGDTPQEIAVSIVAEMIQVRNRKDQVKNL